jgi:hypothetical protein
METRTRAAVAAVVREEDADVVPLAGAGHERGLHVHGRRVTDEGARVDDAARPHLQAGDGNVIGGTVVDAAGQVVDAGLREPGAGEREQQGAC